MTRLMEQAIERLRAVPEPEQDGLAKFVLDAIKDDERWTQSTAAHSDAASRLVEAILADDTRGLCDPLEPEAL